MSAFIKTNNNYNQFSISDNNHTLPNRNVLLQEKLNELSEYEKPNKKCIQKVKGSLKNCNLLSIIYNILPITKWISKYSIKSNLIGDILSGITVGIMQLPQSMAFGILSGVTPSSGLYTAFIAPIVYLIFGTSKIISVGTSAILSMMTLTIVQSYDTSGIEDCSKEECYTPLQIAAAVTFMCGIFQILMHLLQMGSLASLLSEPLISSVTLGTVFHVVGSQLKDILGVQTSRNKSNFKLFYTIWSCSKALPQTNFVTLYISIFTAVFLAFANIVVNPRILRVCRFPLPSELIILVGGILASHFWEFNKNYNVAIVGHIPLGLLEPELPSLRLLWLISIETISVAIVGYTITISVAILYAEKNSNDVKANQELLALGMCNVVTGLFFGIPNGTSLCRTVIQKECGGKTQICSVVSAILVLFILLWIGTYMESLPICILSIILLFSIRGVFKKIFEIKRFYKQGKLEFFTWIVSFALILILDLHVGLFVGLALSILTVYIKGWKTKSCMLGLVPGTDIYVDLATHKRAQVISEIQIFRFIGPINFTARSTFSKTFFQAIFPQHNNMRKSVNPNVKNIIMDLCCVPHMDVAGVRILIDIEKHLKLLNINFIVASPNDNVFDAIKHVESMGEGTFLVMSSINDAVFYAKKFKSIQSIHI